MGYDLDDTICAVASAGGGAARGIVRVSGPATVAVVGRVFAAAELSALESLRRAEVIVGHVRVTLPNRPPALLRHGGSSAHQGGDFLVPCDLFLWPTDRSYTRQPVAELHTLGSPPVLEALVATLCAAGARPAEPGEFTLRAFLAGRIDLTQAEAVLGVIDARGDQELAASLAQLAGGLARPLHALRDELLQLLAELEAGLDFVEDDIEFISAAELIERLEGAQRHLAEVAEQMASRLTASPAHRVAIVGPPNAGKSSLFNAMAAHFGVRELANRFATSSALVSPERGTTRDYLTAEIELDGVRCELVDTAGVDAVAASSIESAAQELSGERRRQATIRAWCSDAVAVVEPPADSDLVVLTKSDILARPEMRTNTASGLQVVAVSSQTGAGLDELCRKLRKLLVRETAAEAGLVLASTSERSRESVRLAAIALSRAVELVRSRGGDELVAAEVRGAIAEIGKIVGAVYTDDLLDRIFSSFCVGK